MNRKNKDSFKCCNGWTYDKTHCVWQKKYYTNNKFFGYVTIFKLNKEWYLGSNIKVIEMLQLVGEPNSYGPFLGCSIPFYQNMIDNKVNKLLKLKMFW